MADRSPRRLVDEAGLPRHEAERLLAAASRLTRRDLAVVEAVGAEAVSRFEALVRRRRAGEPLQYLEGSVQFGHLELLTDRRALIPRPETEQLWEAVVAEIGDGAPRVIVDLCTGSGNLALALKSHYPEAAVHGTDISAAALDLAAQNARRTRLDVEWHEGDLFDALPASLAGHVDVLVANPPYLADHELEALPRDVRDHEPRVALVAGPSGDELLAGIAAQAFRWLVPGGVVACEISEFRSAIAKRMFGDYAARVTADLSGRPRFVIGRTPAG